MVVLVFRGCFLFGWARLVGWFWVFWFWCCALGVGLGWFGVCWFWIASFRAVLVCAFWVWSYGICCEFWVAVGLVRYRFLQSELRFW